MLQVWLCFTIWKLAQVWIEHIDKYIPMLQVREAVWMPQSKPLSAFDLGEPCICHPNITVERSLSSLGANKYPGKWWLQSFVLEAFEPILKVFAIEIFKKGRLVINKVPCPTVWNL